MSRRDRPLEDRRILLTGASSGIGAALVPALVAAGARVVLAARRRAALEDVARRADPGGGRTRTLLFDAADGPAIPAAVDRAAEAFSGLDIVIANAGLGIPSPVDTLRQADLRAVFEVNVFGAVATLLEGLRHVRNSPDGMLVGVSSIAAWRSGPGAAPYNASKAALTSFLEGIRPELEPRGIAVLEVNPGFVKTPMTDRNAFPMPFLIDADRAARTITRAIVRRRRRIAFPWPMALLMGLVRRLPDPLYDSLARAVAGRLARIEALGVEKRGD